VIVTPRQFGTHRLRTLRGIAALCVVLAYLLTSALHVCQSDVTAPASGATTMSMPVTADNHSAGHALAADHHCHGCFSVAVPAPAMLAARAEPAVSRPSQPQTHVASLAPSIDTPPPKHLT
jgi:hypothetical protein